MGVVTGVSLNAVSPGAGAEELMSELVLPDSSAAAAEFSFCLEGGAGSFVIE